MRRVPTWRRAVAATAMATTLPFTVAACAEQPPDEPGVADEEDPGADEEEQLDEDEPVKSEGPEPTPLDEDE